MILLNYSFNDFFIKKVLNSECTFLLFCVLFVTGREGIDIHRLSGEYSSYPLLLQKLCPEKYKIKNTKVKRETKKA